MFNFTFYTHPTEEDKGWKAYLRRDFQNTWIKVNPILKDREVVYEQDTDRFKVGPGRYNDLPYYRKDD